MTKKTTPKIVSIGLDLSLTGTGVVVMVNGKTVKSVVVTSKPTDKTAPGELARLLKIRSEIWKVIGGYLPDVVVIEGLAFMAHNTTALAQLAALNYLVREKLFAFGLRFVVVAPTTLKKYITGKGNAPKEQMLMETLRNYGVAFVDNNLCDAFGLATLGNHVMDTEMVGVSTREEVVALIRPQLEAFDKHTR